MMLSAMPCSDLCVLCVYFHAIWLDPCLHMLYAIFQSLSSHALCYLPYACVLNAMFVCLDLGYVCHAICYCSPFIALSLFLVLWPIG